MKRTLAILALLFVGVSMLAALDVRDGLVRVVVDETTGRLILYRLTTVKGSQYEALFFDDDARTSFLSISLDGRKIKLGESQEFKISAKRLLNGASIEFTSPVLSLTQRVEFIKSTDSRVFNGFKISYEAKNLGKRDYKLSLRQIWDTRLGEKSGVHFITGNLSRFDTEQIFQGETMIPYLISPGEAASLGLLLDKLAHPDIVVVANWKRLSDTAWMYDNPMRGFSLSPYSINDSALGLYWNEIILKAGASHVFIHYFLTGGEGREFVKDMKTGLSIANEQIASPLAATTTSAKDKLLLDIEEIKKILVSLDTAIETVDSVKDEEVQTLLDRLASLAAAAGTEK
ncbi:MAG: hypothetical protein NT061_04940 [Spirochaetes bacterium]|nr:hypothetical protein [Spirochaetota bacterium]